MVYLEDFEVFYSQAVELFEARPLDTRYSVKYRHCDGKLVFKVTDDVKVSSHHLHTADPVLHPWWEGGSCRATCREHSSHSTRAGCLPCHTVPACAGSPLPCSA